MSGRLAALLLILSSLPAGYFETKLYPGIAFSTPITWINLALGISILLAWYWSDARAMQRKPTAAEGFLIGGFAIIGIPLYLFASRSFLPALKANAYAALTAYAMIRAWDVGAITAML